MTAQSHHDFNRLLRGAIGFDRLPDLLAQTLSAETQPTGFPPYNIEKTDENTYAVVLAVAGFAESEIEIEQRDNALIVSGQSGEDESERTYLHRGIANRSFRRQFHLAEHVKVEGASLENGLLRVDLRRELPEERRPRKIEISKTGA